MNWHKIKIAGTVVAVAVIGYIFFLATAQHNKPGISKAQIKNKAVQQAVLSTPHQTSHAKNSLHPLRLKKHRVRHRHTKLARSKPKPIAPVKTLRKTERFSRFGPPSKMYGGL